jgi:magnesium-transporting ATPase (P-type)
MEINGLPAHVLIIHAAVVFIPLAAMSALVYVWVPKWRWAARWPSVGLAGVASVAVLAAYFSGRNFKDHYDKAGVKVDGLQLHEERAQVLLWVTLVFVAIVLLAAWGLGGPSALKSDWGARGKHDLFVERSLIAGVTVFALATLLMTIQTGDAGANAVWSATWDALK